MKTTIKQTNARALRGLRALTLAAAAVLASQVAMAAAVVIDFEGDSNGAKLDGFQSVASMVVSFTDPGSEGENLGVLPADPQSIGRGLISGGDTGTGIQMDFAPPVFSLSLVFGNDEPGIVGPTDLGRLTLFNGATQVAVVDVAVNADDVGNQTVAYSGGPITRAVFAYVTAAGGGVGLGEIIDNVTFDTAPPSDFLLKKGNAVPGVTGKTFTGFGVPAIGPAGEIAVIGKYVGGAGLFVDGTLLAKTGDEVATGVTIKSFKDPVVDSSGAVVFPGALAGTGITTANDVAVLSNAGGDLAIVAQEGAEPVGVTGGKWKSFTSVAAPGGGKVIFLATMVQGQGSVTSENDLGVWAADSAGDLQLLLREGVTQFDGVAVKSFVILKAVNGSPGQTHAFNGSHLVVRVALTDGTTGVVKLNLPEAP